MKLRPYQLDVVSRVHQAWDEGKRCPVMVMGTGTGKCLAPGTPVRMFDGSVLPVEEIVVGDQVMGPDSLPRLVTSTARGCEMMYRVTPTKGDSYTVNESHILSFRISGKDAVTGPDGRVYTKGDVANIEVRDYLRASKTFKHVAKGWRVAVEYADAPLPADLPPYILGVWLGDGTTAAPAISSVDPEVVSAWYEYAATVNATVRREENGTCPSYYVVSDPDDGRGRGYHPNRLINQLRATGVWSDKHIPRAYLVNSRANRLQLLAGIVDTDGYLGNNTYDLVFKQPRLAHGVAELARSLGFAANVKPCLKTCTNTGATGEYFRICISGDLSIIPCRVPRRIASARRQVKNVLRVGIAVEPVGVGKYYGFTLAGPDRLFLLGDFTVTHNTATLSHIVAHEQRPSLVMAHRQELVGQLSLTLGKYGVRHRIIAPDTTRRQIEALHMRHLGRRWIDPHAPVAAAGVQTIIRRDSNDAFMRSIDLIIPDEFHHCTRENSWGRAIQMMPERARILGPTATPLRADGKGLGIHADGFADELILGPSMRDSIVSGMLTPYRIFCPPTGNLDLSQVATSAGGDFSPKPLAEAVHKSTIVGDVVGSYLRIAPGKRGITFAVDLEHAREICAEYKAKGVPAAVLSADSDTGYRAQVMRDFETGTLLQLVNVDILGEGVDVPACEVVSFARPTQSFGLYVQQFGRALRLMIAPELLGMWGDMTDGERAAHIAASVKPTAFIIDHVGNVLRHGLPDAPRRWSLDRREKRGASKGPSDAIPLRVCLAQLPDGTLCTTPYERVLSCCPACGHAPEPAGRSRPEEVDGDLYELDERTLAALRGEAERIMAPPLIPQHLDHVAAMALRKRHTERQQAQGRLGEALAWWGGWQEAQGRDMREAYRRFYFAFGVDVATARTLNRTDAEALAAQVEQVLLDAGVAMRYI